MPATLMIKLALACALAATAARAASLQASHARGVAAGFCAELNPDLPNFCSCNDLDDGAKVDCLTDIFGNPLKFSVTIAPCASPDATLDFEVDVNGTPWDYTIKAGSSGTEPIPGLTFSIGVASAAAVLDYSLDGNADHLEVDLGIDACVDVPFLGKKCGADVSSELPIPVINHTFSFGACAEPPLAVAQV